MANTRRNLLSAIFGIAAFASAGTAFAANNPVQLGILAPLTGGAAADGEVLWRDVRTRATNRRSGFIRGSKNPPIIH